MKRQTCMHASAEEAWVSLLELMHSVHLIATLEVQLGRRLHLLRTPVMSTWPSCTVGDIAVVEGWMR